MKCETFVIVNPSSGGGWALRAEPRLQVCCGAGCHAEFVHSKSAEDIRDLRRAQRRKDFIMSWRWAEMGRSII